MEAALNQDSLEGTILHKPVHHLKLVQISGSTLGLIIADVVCASVYWLIIAIYSSGNAWILYPCINYILFDWMDTEDMILSLQQASWQKVDLTFHSAIWPFFAHSPVGVSLSSLSQFLYASFTSNAGL
jgi:hypothetical protein